LLAEALLDAPATTSLDSGTHFTNSISPGEVKMLVGLTANNNTFWPFPVWFENLCLYNGELSQANEA
jgi:hypothetical protein